MSQLLTRALSAIALLTVLPTSLLAAQKLNVKIVDRQTSGTNYSYVVPGDLTSHSNTSENCFGAANTVNCSSSTSTTGSVTPPRPVSYEVRGATFSLQLPDGRIAVVNCESKYSPKFDYINRRSCRMPLVNDIQAEFDGDKAKLIWSVSIDSKKTESETYKILAVLDKPSTTADKPSATLNEPSAPLDRPSAPTVPTAEPAQTTPRVFPNVEGANGDGVRTLLGPPSLAQTESDRLSVWYYDTGQGTVKVYFVDGRATLRRP